MSLTSPFPGMRVSAAIRAAQLGASVVLIEQGRVGGTCITVGCIPTEDVGAETAHD